MMRTNSRRSSMGEVFRRATATRSAVPAEYLGGRRPLRAPLQATRRPRGQQSVPHPIEVRQGEEREGPRGVLCQPAVAHLGKTPQLLDHQEGVLPARPDARARAIDRLPPGAQRMFGGPAPFYAEAHPALPERLSQPLAPVRPI